MCQYWISGGQRCRTLNLNCSLFFSHSVKKMELSDFKASFTEDVSVFEEYGLQLINTPISVSKKFEYKKYIYQHKITACIVFTAV